MKSTTLLIYLNSGGGHRTPAEAIAEAIELRYGVETRPVLVDGLQGSSRFVRFVIEDGYRILQAHASWATIHAMRP
jgi:hypothetical protein